MTTTPATKKCTVCDLLMVSGRCPHCDDACLIASCRHCRGLKDYEGVGPGSDRWKKGLRP